MISEYSEYSDERLLSSDSLVKLVKRLKLVIDFPQSYSYEKMIVELLEFPNNNSSEKFSLDDRLLKIQNLREDLLAISQVWEELEENIENKLKKIEREKRKQKKVREACAKSLEIIGYNIDMLLSVTIDKKFNSTEITREYINAKIDELMQEFKKMSEESKRVIHVTGSYLEQGNHIGSQINHPKNKKVEEQDLKEQVAELRELVIQLQQKHKPTTEAEAITVIDAEFSEIQRTDLPRWQVIQEQRKLLRDQILNPERHFAATKETLSEIAKHYLEENVVGKAIVTYLKTMSAAPTQGE